MILVEEMKAASNDELLAKKFSPVLILTEDTRERYGNISVIKPEPVSIIGAQSANYIRFELYNKLGQQIGGVFDWESLTGWDPPIFPRVDFSQNKFAFLGDNYIGKPLIKKRRYAYGQYFLVSYFDYPGKGTRVWDDTYFGEGAYAGDKFPNTAYVHIYERTIDKYKTKYNTITVIEYKYFYPYNDWWNNHEGDWQGIDVVVSSRDPATSEFLGVEYRFHGAWLSYYKDYGDKPGITDSFVFNAVGDVRLVARTHPVAYIGAGSHAAYPIGGDIELFSFLEALPLSGGADQEGTEEAIEAAVIGDWEYMSHTGLVLSTLADGSHNDLWESYNLVLLPDPDITNTNNMGLTPDMSWLGAQVRWGTPTVSGPGENESPKGPYNSKTDSWGSLKLFTVGKIGGEALGVSVFDPFYHSDLYAPGSSPLSVTEYHHWAIISAETWSGTVSLHGDIVVFPGATLTVEAGSVIEFVPRQDRHQFREGVHNRAEIFVYGTLITEGIVQDSVHFQATTDGDNDAWGGIRAMAGGTVTLDDYTVLRHTPSVSPPSVSPPVAESKPGRPRNLSATPGDGQVTLSWQGPDDLGGSTLSHYGYIWRVAGGTWSATDLDEWTSVGTATSAVVANLTNGTTYDFKVRTFTNAHMKRNRASLPAEAFGIQPTSGSVVPGPPQALQAVPGSGQVSLSWSAPSSDGGSALTGYEYRYRLGDGGWYGWSSVGLNTTTTKTGLADNTTYTFAVRAVNAQGAGTAASQTVTTPPGTAGPPGMPRNLSATPWIGQVSLSWSAPSSDGGSALTGYEYRYQVSGGSWSSWSSVGLSTSKTVTGLAANTTYTFEVRAVNAHGFGTAASRSATTPGSSNVPSAPRNLEATASTGQVALDWDGPSSNGGSAITKYEYRWRADSGTWSPWWSVSASTTSKTVTGLSANTTYTFDSTGSQQPRGRRVSQRVGDHAGGTAAAE